MFPFPSVFQEIFTRQICFLNSFFLQQSHHFCFSSNRSMVGTGYPAGIFALHPRSPYQYILNCIVKHMPHVQHPCYVWRWYYYCIWFTFVRRGFKKFMSQPMGIPFVFCKFWVVCFWNIHNLLLSLHFEKERQNYKK